MSRFSDFTRNMTKAYAASCSPELDLASTPRCRTVFNERPIRCLLLPHDTFMNEKYLTDILEIAILSPMRQLTLLMMYYQSGTKIFAHKRYTTN